METPDHLYGLILTGGYSRRMGQDKAFIEYHGVPQYEYLYQLLQSFCQQVFLSCRKDQATKFPANFTAVFDLYDGIGPMNGLLSFFEKFPDAACLVAACDMPFVDKETVRHLIQNRNPRKIATVFLNGKGSPEPVLSIWEPASFTILKEQFAKNKYSLLDILKANDIHRLKPQNPKVLLNVNDPKTLELVRKGLKLPPEKL